jgi:hypothetical protein
VVTNVRADVIRAAVANVVSAIILAIVTIVDRSAFIQKTATDTEATTATGSDYRSGSDVIKGLDGHCAGYRRA